MKTGETKTPPTPLIFDWPRRNRFSFLFLGFVAVSVLAHVATFFLFQVVYPQRVTIPEPAPRVSLLTPSSPENIALLNWIEAEDPALAARGVNIDPPGLAAVHYQPSYAVPHTAPLGAGAERSDPVRFPEARDPLSLIGESTTSGIKLAPTSPPHFTSVSVSGALSTRLPKEASPLHFARPSANPLQPSQWLIGVSDRGEVRYVFLQDSSGDASFDELASAHVRELNFGISDAPITWGFAHISWGDDAYGIPIPENAPVTPPAQ